MSFSAVFVTRFYASILHNPCKHCKEKKCLSFFAVCFSIEKNELVSATKWVCCKFFAEEEGHNYGMPIRSHSFSDLFLEHMQSSIKWTIKTVPDISYIPKIVDIIMQSCDASKMLSLEKREILK